VDRISKELLHNQISLHQRNATFANNTLVNEISTLQLNDLSGDTWADYRYADSSEFRCKDQRFPDVWLLKAISR